MQAKDIKRYELQNIGKCSSNKTEWIKYFLLFATSPQSMIKLCKRKKHTDQNTVHINILLL